MFCVFCFVFFLLKAYFALKTALLVAGRIGLDYLKINSCPPQKSNGLINIKWQAPPLDWIKVNFDGSVCGNLAATDFVIYDWNGNIRLIGAKNSGQVSITVAECLALRDGLTHAILYKKK